ncbi:MULTISPECIES: putative entry exclusion protein TrbK-alt [Sphingobium]|uniref:Conjugal transfer protein TrbK n=1 Tax=Sphingobium baderi TaxID=1332080 RepID=A0A0S3EW92_9SPHN|nr:MULTISPECIES: putative entry exclusion protein TrbK-alt [Sphingobium]ALR19684.1 hypothetical protein ATN00_04545 [Sphingobium baderi]
MSRTAKIAGVAALAGLMMTVAIVAAVQPDEPAPAPPLLLPVDEGQARVARELDRCATLTMPDSGCEAAWAANRRRFFRQEESAPETERGSDMAPDEGATP